MIENSPASTPHPPRGARLARRCLTAIGATVLAGTALLALTACSGGSGSGEPAVRTPVPLPSPTTTRQQVSEENLGYMWPLTVDHVTAECHSGDQAVVIVPDGRAYALNDRAREAGYADIGPLRATGSGGHQVSLGPLLSRTMRLCGVTH